MTWYFSAPVGLYQKMGRSGVPNFTSLAGIVRVVLGLQVVKETETSAKLHDQAYVHVRHHELNVLQGLDPCLARLAVLGLDFLLKRDLDSRLKVACVKGRRQQSILLGDINAQRFDQVLLVPERTRRCSSFAPCSPLTLWGSS